jgi:serine/threonine-protein phosphatase 2B catalytic subunit
MLIQEECLIVAEMLLAVLSVCSEEELEDTSSDEDETRTIADLALSPNEIAQRRQQIKNKILAVGRMQRVFQILRYASLTFLSLEPN